MTEEAEGRPEAGEGLEQLIKEWQGESRQTLA
jgi:hypothetical protein